MSFNDLAKFGRYIFFFMFFLMFCVTSLLVYEYSYFRNRVLQLEALKEDYTTYLLTLKKLILEYDRVKDSQDADVNLDEKKKRLNDAQVFESSDNESGDLFPVVNRESEYLLRESLAFAKLHNLEYALQKKYVADEAVVKSNNIRT